MTPLIVAGDLFAGAGGTSTGMVKAVRAMGARLQLAAVNHWPVAVETHARNHPEAAHHCLDISTARPEDVVPGGYLDLLCASPECVFFSRARGGKPVNDQRRSGAWWLLEWLARLDVRCLLVENVEEFLFWGPVLPSGKPDPTGRGRYFEAWVQALWGMGYAVDWRVLNAADYGDATTRKRLFVQARKDGRPLRWPEPTHSKTGSADLFGGLPRWKPAREIIDESDLGPSMLERSKPLSLKTRLRIARGLQRFGGMLAPLYIRLLDLPTEDERRCIERCADGPVRSFALGRHSSPSVRSVDDPTPTSTANGAGYLVSSTAEPFIAVNTENAIPKATSEPLGTITTIPGVYLAAPTAEPFVFGNRENNVSRGTDQPIPSLTTATGGGAYIITPQAEPFTLGQHGGGEARPVGEPIPTIATDGVIRLFSPTAEPFIDHYYGTGVADSIREPLSTVTTKPRHAVVSPLAVPYGPKAEARSADGPLHAILTKDRLGLAMPIASVITPGFAEREGQLPRVHAIDEPAPAIAATGHLHLATATVEQIQAAIGAVDPRRLVFIDGILHLLDIRFRMLKNSELAAAMGFPSGYVFHGTKSEVTKQIGNAVAVGVAAALVGAMLEDGVAERRAS